MSMHSVHVEVEMLRPVETERCVPVGVAGKRHSIPLAVEHGIPAYGRAIHEPVEFLAFGDELRDGDARMASGGDGVEPARGVYGVDSLTEWGPVDQQRDLSGIVRADVREHDLAGGGVPCHGEIHHAILRVLPDGLAGKLVRLTRLEQGDHTGDATQRADPTDDHIRDIPSIHKPNATNTNTTARTEALASKEGEEMNTTCDLNVDWRACPNCARFKERIEDAEKEAKAVSANFDRAYAGYREDVAAGRACPATPRQRAWSSYLDDLEMEQSLASTRWMEAINAWAVSIHRHHRRYEARQQEAEDGEPAETEEMDAFDSAAEARETALASEEGEEK